MSTPSRTSPFEREREHERERERDHRRRATDRNLLVEEIARVLPRDHKFSAYHLSTTPTITDSLCYPPAYSPTSESKSPAEAQAEPRERRPSKPLKTYCEKHFLAVSIDAEHGHSRLADEVLVLGIEVYIYTTAFSTIIFVAKADSTGYLSLLDLSRGTTSPIREITAAFLSFLITTRRRHSKQLVVNLFARSQSQYLFPGSVKNKGKHVLDDRGLVKWWCRVLNPLLEDDDTASKSREGWGRIHGYLVIPGLDNYETRAFLPRTNGASKNWTFGHPLERMSPFSRDPSTFGHDIPPRCLIPTYPDDPKARFVEELEESTSEKAKLLGGWKTPRTLDEFWDMMAFRQECSSGRMTGFVWVVFDPPANSVATIPTPNVSFSAPSTETDTGTSSTLQEGSGQDLSSLNPRAPALDRPKRKRPVTKILKGRIIPRKPQVKSHNRTHFPERIETPHYYWPEAGRGQVVLNENGYKRAVELLLNLEFSTLAQAIMSTARWAKEVNVGEDWALRIVGERESASQPTAPSGAGTVHNLAGMVKRKRPAEQQPRDDEPPAPGSVNVLSGMLIRKKAKDAPADGGAAQDSPAQTEAGAEPTVNVLAAGLVRKKAT